MAAKGARVTSLTTPRNAPGDEDTAERDEIAQIREILHGGLSRRLDERVGALEERLDRSVEALGARIEAIGDACRRIEKDKADRERLAALLEQLSRGLREADRGGGSDPT